MFHEPVLMKDVVDLLISDPNGTYLDGTLGGGGHGRAILQNLDQGRLIGLDLDNEAILFARDYLRQYKTKLTALLGNFKDLSKIVKKLRIDHIHGLLLDLGVSSYQIDTADRGFSFDAVGRLDMRMNSAQKRTACEIVDSCSEEELSALFKDYGEERRAGAVARAIAKERHECSIKTTAQLKAVISAVLPYKNRAKSLARIFQALRIAVNDELRNLSEGLNSALDHLTSGGRIVVVSYHSLEDRMVKDFFKRESQRCVCPPELPVCICGKKGRLRILTKRPIRPSDEEIQRNPRSRSAKLRAAETIG